MKEPVLEVKNLTTRFHLIDHTVTAVNNVSFTLHENEILGIIGESGSGKSVTSHSILHLIEEPGTIDKESRILFRGRDIMQMSEREMREIRGSRISMIFQEPSASFNPLFSIGSQIGESLRIHMGTDRKSAEKEAARLMELVHIPNADRKASDYPFQMSGGMLQRSMTAMALACTPDILIADEPTTALDVTTQAQILGLIKEKQETSGMSVIFITHDMALVEDFCHRIMIMYAGRIMEIGNASDIIHRPQHPYTADLLRAILRPGMLKGKDSLFSIPGKVPSPGEIIRGCAYADRCSRCTGKCRNQEPELTGNVRCWNA